jgi:hypothetical protein
MTYEGILRDVGKRAEEGEGRRWRGQRSTSATEARPRVWPGSRMSPQNAEGVGEQIPPTPSVADHQAQGPKNDSHPLLFTPTASPPQGSMCWRKTGKATKIFQIRQICGVDKSRAGWDEVSVAPQWGGPIKSGLWLQKNASSPALGGGSLSQLPPQKEHRLVGSRG